TFKTSSSLRAGIKHRAWFHFCPDKRRLHLPTAHQCIQLSALQNRQGAADKVKNTRQTAH
ncbi:unnamed protein product, partial [Bubo scandiacus]